jgi:hypothetical protein
MSDLLSFRKLFHQDMNIPITVCSSPYFDYQIDLLGFTKAYEVFEKTVLEKYTFVTDYKEYCARIITQVSSVIADFPGLDTIRERVRMKKIMGPPFGISYFLRGYHENVYMREKTHKKLLMIDLAQANFQSLRYMGIKYPKDALNWQIFLRQYTDNEHILSSKNIRQVIFGKVTPNIMKMCRYIQQEMISIVIDILFKQYPQLIPEKIVALSDDAVALDITDISDISNVPGNMCSISDIQVHYHISEIEVYQLQHKVLGKSRVEFYLQFEWPSPRTFPLYCNYTVHQCPKTFRIIVKKLLQGKILEYNDLVFLYEGCLAVWVNDFQLAIGIENLA